MAFGVSVKIIRGWKEMKEPVWANLSYPMIDYNDISYFSAPRPNPESLDEVDPGVLKTYERLGIPLEEQKLLSGVAVDAVFDSVSVKTTFQKELEELVIIFCSISEAAHKHPELLKKISSLGGSQKDNFFAALTVPYLQTVLLCISPLIQDALWNYPRIFG